MHGSRRLFNAIRSIACLLLIFTICGCKVRHSNVGCCRLDTGSEPVNLSEDISVKQLCSNIWLQTNMYIFDGMTRAYPSNGIVIIDKGKAVIIDTPCTDKQTETLINWIEKEQNAKVCCVVPTHWHIDCAGGMQTVLDRNINSITLDKTISIMKEKSLSAPAKGFVAKQTICCGRLNIELYYPGPGHTVDNIVAYVPDCKLLFGGCMVKNAGATNLGNISEADLKQWPVSLEKMKQTFPDAEIIIPGHGRHGGYEIVDNTIALLNNRQVN